MSRKRARHPSRHRVGCEAAKYDSLGARRRHQRCREKTHCPCATCAVAVVGIADGEGRGVDGAVIKYCVGVVTVSLPRQRIRMMVPQHHIQPSSPHLTASPVLGCEDRRCGLT
jgi:hypothetical protein